jgi:hypothetical protein
MALPCAGCQRSEVKAFTLLPSRQTIHLYMRYVAVLHRCERARFMSAFSFS